MHDQARAWGQVAHKYDDLFVDPYHEDGDNPVLRAIKRLKNKARMTVADFGCGTGPFLLSLARDFKQVLAVDFSREMLTQAKRRCRSASNITYHHLTFDELGKTPVELDVAVSMNSLVSHDVGILDRALISFHQAMQNGGRLLGVVPSLEGLQYHVMLLIDLGLKRGLDLKAAQQFAAKKAELSGYDLNTATFTFDNIKQHLWLKEEVLYRLKKAGWQSIQIRKARLPWNQFAEGRSFHRYTQSWDWAFSARK